MPPDFDASSTDWVRVFFSKELEPKVLYFMATMPVPHYQASWKDTALRCSSTSSRTRGLFVCSMFVHPDALVRSS
jgi:hypothetical protein